MIPIGTRCILVVASNPDWVPHVGKAVTVVGYNRDDDGHGRHEITFDDGTKLRGRFGLAMVLCSDPPDIIPIGHDPDAETRKTEREVEA